MSAPTVIVCSHAAKFGAIQSDEAGAARLHIKSVGAYKCVQLVICHAQRSRVI